MFDKTMTASAKRCGRIWVDQKRFCNEALRLPNTFWEGDAERHQGSAGRKNQAGNDEQLYIHRQSQCKKRDRGAN